MDEVKIEKPKVFISYAWGTEAYQAKVLSFATELVSDGIDVVFDKWSLKEGNDTYTFMEQTVTDEEITNVLILLDPQYEKKANERSGGVGTETQIISSDIYTKVNQEKFIPIVFERGVDGSISKPAYLKGLLHFDLSIAENFDGEYKRLVKRLYGIDIIKKPPLGNKPSWLTEEIVISTRTMTAFDYLKSNLTVETKIDYFNKFLDGIKGKIVDFKKDDVYDVTCSNIIELYSETKPIRDEFLELIRYISYVERADKLIADKFEEICIEINNRHDRASDIRKVLLHEMFIYLIAFYYKNKNFSHIGYTLSKTYFVKVIGGNEANNYNIFYHTYGLFDEAVSVRDNKKYFSGTACYWIDNINVDFCSKNEFVLADILCYNASYFMKEYEYDWQWFPLTYIYGKNVLRDFSIRLKSTENLKEAVMIFGYESIEEFKLAFADVEDKIKYGVIKAYRYNNSFDDAPLLCNYIKLTELGARR